MDKAEDVIELLESVKNWTDPVSDEHPFGTVDYMQMDAAIEFLRGMQINAIDEIEIRKKWREICTQNRQKGCIIDSGSFAVALVRWVESGLTKREPDKN
jgi:hypothetical protein